MSLSLSQVSVSLAQQQVLRNITACFASGRWTAVVGVNGCGKSTLLRALAGLLPFTGDIRWQGRALSHMPSRERAQRIARLGQDSAASEDATVQDIALLGRLPHQGLLAAPTAQDHRAVDWALQQVDLMEWRTRRISDLSAGERQRALLARALATQASVLLLDEPLAALDVPHQVQFAKLMRELAAQGVTVITVLHELHIALHADELLLMAGGEVAGQGRADETDMHRAVEQLFSGSLRVAADRSVQPLLCELASQ